MTAELLSQLINGNPETWRFQHHRLEDVLARRGKREPPVGRRILWEDGSVVLDVSPRLPFPVVARRAPLFDAGVPVGEIEILMSLRPLALRTGMATFAGVLLGGAVFVALRVLPLRALERSRAERLRAESALRDSEERFRSAFEDSGIGMALQTLDGRYSRVNRALCQMLGYAEEELLAMDCRTVTHPACRDQDERAEREMLAGARTSQQAEKQYLHKRGHPAWGLATSSLVRAEDGSPRYFIVQVQDVTERHRLDETRADLEDELRHAQKLEAVGRLAGGIAHEFNNLLTVITGRSELLLQPDGVQGASRRNVELILSTADRAAQLTQQLLAFSRKQILRPIPVDLDTVVASMEAILRRVIGEHIKVVSVLGATRSRVRADPGQLEHVVLNLCLNARDAMPSGGTLTLETVDAELDAAFVQQHPGSRPGRYVMLAVGDTGHGIDPTTQAHLFEPFFTTKEIGRGTGLGLASVYGIVKQSDGYIRVHTELGRGTRFEIYLPRLEDRAPSDEPGRAGVRSARGSETILLVEDEEAVRHLAREVLEKSGYVVLEARQGIEALRAVEQHARPVDLLLTDVVMPAMSGRELANRLAGLHPAMRVMFMSGYTDDLAVQRGLLGPHEAFLAKPFTPDRLRTKVREVLDSRPDR